VKKVEKKQRPFGEGLEEAMRLARRFDGDGDAPVDSRDRLGRPRQTESPRVSSPTRSIKQYEAG
jgi:hypothetical protein